MSTANERLLREAVTHAVYLNRYSNHAIQRIIKQLNKMDKELLAEITETLERLPAKSFTVQRLEQLLKSVEATNKLALELVYAELRTELRGFAAYEAGYQLELFRSLLPPVIVTEIGVAKVNVEKLFSATLSKPMQGRLLKQWAKSIGIKRLERVKDAIVIGYSEGRTTDEIVRQLRGSRAKGYRDGVLNGTRNDIASVVDTAIGHVAADTRQAFYERNKSLIKAIKWVSTLDTKTTPDCFIRDGLLYRPSTFKPINHNYKWRQGPGKLHFRCRSTETPVTKSYRELGIDIDEVPPSERASMDGQVPADMTFRQWFDEQTAARQNQVLGPRRAKMYRDQGLSLDKFFSDKGDFLTLEELKEIGIN